MDKLTDREKQVLRLIGQGKTNRQIGEALDIKEGTAKVHIFNLMRKLGVENRVAAALKAQELALT